MNQPPIKEPPSRVRQRWRARANAWRIWWEPETALRELGFEPVELNPKRLTWSVREAKRLNGLVDQRRTGVATLARAGGADPREVADALGNKAFSDDELSQIYMPPTYESASKAVNAVKRPKGKA